MDNTYVVKKNFEDAGEVIIENFPWDKSGYRPRTLFKMYHDIKGFHLFFKSYETKIRAVNTQLNSRICEDSCMEFFFNPNPEKDDRYMNFEMNPNGTFLLGFGSERNGRIKIDDINIVEMEIKAVVNDEFWSLEYIIPINFITKYYGSIDFISGHIMKGNIYKCGDKTDIPHYGCWNMINWEKPDFHRPEFFGNFIIE